MLFFSPEKLLEFFFLNIYDPKKRDRKKCQKIENINFESRDHFFRIPRQKLAGGG